MWLNDEAKSEEIFWECLTVFWSSGVRPLGTRGEFIIKRIAAVDGGTDQASTGPHSDCVMFTLSSQLSRIERSYIGKRRRRSGGKARNWIVCTAESLNGHDKWWEAQ